MPEEPSTPLRREWGICVALVHGAHAAVFPGSGALRSLRGAVCVAVLSSQGHGALFSALIAGARAPFQRLNCEERL